MHDQCINCFSWDIAQAVLVAPLFRVFSLKQNQTIPSETSLHTDTAAQTVTAPFDLGEFRHPLKHSKVENPLPAAQLIDDRYKYVHSNLASSWRGLPDVFIMPS